PLPPSFAKQPEAFQVIVRARADELPPERHLGQQGISGSSAADGELLPASVAVGRVRLILTGTAGTGHREKRSSRCRSAPAFTSFRLRCRSRRLRRGRLLSLDAAIPVRAFVGAVG